MKWIVPQVCAALTLVAAAVEDKLPPSNDDYLIGMYYFAGW